MADIGDLLKQLQEAGCTVTDLHEGGDLKSLKAASNLSAERLDKVGEGGIDFNAFVSWPKAF